MKTHPILSVEMRRMLKKNRFDSEQSCLSLTAGWTVTFMPGLQLQPMAEFIGTLIASGQQKQLFIGSCDTAITRSSLKDHHTKVELDQSMTAAERDAFFECTLKSCKVMRDGRGERDGCLFTTNSKSKNILSAHKSLKQICKSLLFDQHTAWNIIEVSTKTCEGES